MFSISRFALRSSRQSAIARPLASAFSPGTFLVPQARPSNLSELRSFESLLQRYNSNYGGGYGGGNQGGYDGGRGGYTPRNGSPTNRAFRNQNLAPTKVIYVGNLQFEVKEDDLKEEFKAFGPIQSVKIIYDNRGLSKGFGYVEFETIEQATAAIEASHNGVLMGRRMNIQYVHRPNTTSVNEPTKTLFIGNLSFDMTDADFDKLFVGIDGCVDVRVAMDRATGQPRGFAHADFQDVDSALKAKEKLVDVEVFGRRLRIDFSDQRNRGPSGSGGSMGSGQPVGGGSNFSEGGAPKSDGSY